MLKLKTKTEFEVPVKRGVVTAIVRLIIDGLFIDKNNVTAKGYYYYIDENNQVIQLPDGQVNKLMLISDIRQLEPSLPAITSSFFDEITIQRLKEFVFLDLQSANGSNYGALSTDWEIDND